MTFEDVVQECAGNKALVAEFDRLTGYNLGRKGSPIVLMIDDAAGLTQEALEAFTQFVFEMVWVPLARAVGEKP